MSKPPKTVERIRSTGALGQFPGAVLASVEHDVYVLEAEAAAALSEAQATIARLEAEVARLREGLIGVKHSGSLAYAKMTAAETLSPRGGEGT